MPRRQTSRPALTAFGLAAWFGLALSLAAAAPARAAFVISNPGGTWSAVAGQNFSPSVEPNPDPGLAAGDTVFLDTFTFTRGDPAGAGSAATRLVVLPGAYYDTNGNPNGSFTPTINDVVGISTNAFDTAAAAGNTQFVFDFDNLPLTYGDDYAVAFATVGPNDALSFHAVNVNRVNYTETSPGVWTPTANYGGANNWDATSLFPDGNGDGYFEGGDTGDAAFTAVFVVPEPTSIAALGLVGVSLLARRRRRRTA